MNLDSCSPTAVRDIDIVLNGATGMFATQWDEIGRSKRMHRLTERIVFLSAPNESIEMHNRTPLNDNVVPCFHFPFKFYYYF